MDKELEITKEFFNKYKSSYQVLLNQAEQYEDKEVVWSNTYLNLYPYEHIQYNQRSKPKIYSSKPKSSDGIIESWMKNGKVFFAFDARNILWGVEFIISEAGKTIRLSYKADEDDEMALTAVCCVLHNNDLIEKVLAYSRDDSLEDDGIAKETFYVSRYSYIEGKIHSIIRDGFYLEKSNQKFRF